jgi:hypothetical protein
MVIVRTRTRKNGSLLATSLALRIRGTVCNTHSYFINVAYSLYTCILSFLIVLSHRLWCGIFFTCMFADFLSQDLPLMFSQEHIDHCREHIAMSIMHGSIII